MVRTIKNVSVVINDAGIVTLIHKSGAVLAAIRFEYVNFGTFTRVNPNEDNDNYWVAIKPSDSMVFDHGLFDPSKIMCGFPDYQLKPR